MSATPPPVLLTMDAWTFDATGDGTPGATIHALRAEVHALSAALAQERQRREHLKCDLDMVAAQLGIVNRDEVNQRITEHLTRCEQAEQALAQERAQRQQAEQARDSARGMVNTMLRQPPSGQE